MPAAGLMKIDGTTTVVGVLGAPISHTASPAMHNAAFAALKMNWTYLAFHVEPGALPGALNGIRALNFAGVNLTVPHKVAALDLLDEVDPDAKKLGAVNTVAVEDGKLRGYNTDGYGFSKAILEEFNFSLKGKRVLVLGAGGAGRAIAVQCILDGAAKVRVANRTPGKASGFEELPLTSSAVAKVIGDVDLLVNATSVGLRDGDSLGLNASLFSPQLYVYDTIYRPAETALLQQAREGGARVANGLSMLLHQGARSFEIWTKDKMAPIAKMRQALKAAVYGKTK